MFDFDITDSLYFLIECIKNKPQKKRKEIDRVGELTKITKPKITTAKLCKVSYPPPPHEQNKTITIKMAKSRYNPRRAAPTRYDPLAPPSDNITLLNSIRLQYESGYFRNSNDFSSMSSTTTTNPGRPHQVDNSQQSRQQQLASIIEEALQVVNDIEMEFENENTITQVVRQ